MIRFYFKWLITQAVVNIRSISFYLLALLLGLGFILSDTVIKEYNEDTKILMYSDGSELGEYCINYFENNAPDGYSFIEVQSTDVLNEQVSTGEVSCGVIFSDKADDYRRQSNYVTIVQTSGSIDGYIIQELLYPVMVRSSSKEELTKYLSKLKWNDTKDEGIEYIVSTYDNLLQNTEISIYSLQQMDDSKSAADSSDANETNANETNAGSLVDTGKSVSNKMRAYVYSCMIAIVMVICVYDCAGSDKGFYKAFNKGWKLALCMGKVAITCVMASAVAYAFSGIYHIWR